MVNLTGTSYTVLWNFDSTTGAPSGGLTLASADLNFYGTTDNTTNGTLFLSSRFMKKSYTRSGGRWISHAIGFSSNNRATIAESR
jgi:hypothetical protein